MKKIFLLSLLASVTLFASAQTSSSITYLGKKVLKNATENPEKNIIKIQRKSLNKPGNFIISFNNYDTAYKRTVMVDDANRQGIKNFEEINKPLTISNKELKKLLTGRNKIVIYYSKIPSDPSKAAIVRMRPIHICTVIVI